MGEAAIDEGSVSADEGVSVNAVDGFQMTGSTKGLSLYALTWGRTTPVNRLSNPGSLLPSHRASSTCPGSDERLAGARRRP